MGKGLGNAASARRTLRIRSAPPCLVLAGSYDLESGYSPTSFEERVTPPAVIIFIRIPKTGSQTLARIARQNYPPKRSRGLPNMFTKAERCREELERVALRGQVIDLASGHIAFDRNAPLPPGARYFTMLREPVKRAISHYHAYARRAVRDGRLPSDVPIETVIAARTVQAPDNIQTRQLSGHASLNDPPFGECSREMLDEAKQNVDRYFDFVGLTERFDESVVLLAETYGWQNLAYTPVNVWDSPAADDLSSETTSRIAEENLLDVALYEFVQERFARLVAAQGSDFAVNLDALRRSRELSDGTAAPANGDLRSQLVDARARLFLTRLELAESRSHAPPRGHERAKHRARPR